MDNNAYTKKGNIFKVRVISFERLIYILMNNGFKPEETTIEGRKHYTSKESKISLKDLNQVLYSLADEANLFDENALFHQLMIIKNKKLSNVKSKPNVIEEIVYLDFSSNTQNMLSYYSNHVEALFDRGFDVMVGNNIRYHFIPFDKSASMGRQSRISFISTIGYDANGLEIADFYKTVKEHAYLDLLEDQVIGVPLSKRYAYRGLMLSGGRRISLFDIQNKAGLNDFTFNNDTVLIVQDMNVILKEGIKYFTQKAEDELGKDNKLEFSLIDEETSKENEFEKTLNDGFGFIADELADGIDACFNGGNSIKRTKKHNSYQIRLPYVKGVVHRVNFKEFFKEVLKEEIDKNGKIKVRSYDENLEKYYDNDSNKPYYRELNLDELSKVQLILSESMFKIYKELKQYKKHNPGIGNALEFYFDRLNKYNHSLFVLAMDKPVEEDGKINREDLIATWNYQYISTVGLTHEDFEQMYDKSKGIYEKLKTDQITQIEYITKKKYQKNSDESTGEDKDSFKDNNRYSLERKLLLKNKNFINEPYFKRIISDEANSLKNSFGVGQLILDGQTRFLLGDPIRYLYYLVGKECPKENMLEENTFNFPGIEYSEEMKEKEYPVLRNPHLSRNEDLILKLCFPKKGSIRDRYLNNLVGTCIIDSSHSSLPADTISGADMDGDEVKVYFNDIYAKAIKKNRINGNPDGYPLVINTKYIRPEKDDFTYIDNSYNKFKVNMQTFNSYVGQISNLAFKEALKAYTENPEEQGDFEKHKNNVRLLGILTGVEVDSAKTGIKPKFNNIVTKKQKTDDNLKRDPSNYFIDFKAIRKKEKSKGFVKDRFISRLSKDDPNPEQYFKEIYETKDYSKFEKAFLDKTGRKPRNVETLIQKYNELGEIRLTTPKRLGLFNWDEDYTELMEKSKIEIDQIKNIIKAYYKICKEKNYLLHSDNLDDKGIYYDSLAFRAENFNPNNGRVILNNLLNDLTNMERVPYKNFYDLYYACVNKNLVYYYYPYFSNPFKDWDESLKRARKWLTKKFEDYGVPYHKEQMDFLMSDAMNIHFVLCNAQNRRYKNYESVLNNDVVDEIREMLKDEDIDSVTTFINKIEQSFKSITNNMIQTLIKKSNEDIDCKKKEDFNDKIKESKKRVKSAIKNCLATLYKKEGVEEINDKEFDKCVKEALSKLIEDLKYKFDKKAEFDYWDILNNYESVLLANKVSSIYYDVFSDKPSKDLISKVNKYRTAIKEETEAQIKYYEIFKEAIQKPDVYWKESLNEAAIKEMEAIITDSGKKSFTQAELDIEMIKIVRAIEKFNKAKDEESIESKQKFLFECLGDKLLEYVKEGE